MIQLFSINRLNNSLSEHEDSLKQLHPDIDTPGVMVKTCNRVEFYSGNNNVPSYIVKHLFRVVCGLESGILGEIAIQGQIKSSYVEACEKFNLDKGIHSLFQTALYVGKRIRTESGISRGAISYSQAAVEIISKHGIDINKALISLIGVHKINESIIRFLQRKGADTIFLANKSYEKAEQLANIYKCKIMRLDQLEQMLNFSDILITATSAPHLIVKYENFPKEKKMLIIDLAVPRDVEEKIGNLPGITLYNLENIETLVNQNIEKRKTHIDIAEKIIEEEVELFKEKQKRQLSYVQFMEQ